MLRKQTDLRAPSQKAAAASETKMRRSTSADNPRSSTTSKKFRSRSTSGTRHEKCAETQFSGFRIVDFSGFFEQISANLRCSCKCGGEVAVQESGLVGLFSTFEHRCNQCKEVLKIED